MLATPANKQNADCHMSFAPTQQQKLEYRRNQKKSYLITKRIFDIVVSAVAFVICLLPMAVVACLIRLESPGPALFKQERLGKDGKVFYMYKFRSMRMDAEKDGPKWAEEDDPRCTNVGKVIRLWHIDELPQLINILKGEMTIVGPRPEREYFYGEFEKTIPNFRVRLLVDQGLTSVAQVSGGYDITPEEKLAYDIEYMSKQSFWTDLVCIFKTVFVLLERKGAR